VGRLGDGEPIVVQHGSSDVRADNAVNVGFLPFDELVDRVRAARLVVCHAGVGSVMVALANGKLPVVVPRLRRFREAVDDHQLFFARRLASAGLVTLVDDLDELSSVIESAAEQIAQQSPTAATSLANELHALIEGRVSRERVQAHRVLRPRTLRR
jgi:UDP-N-acetylglucosamine transferase subunit ALG13